MNGFLFRVLNFITLQLSGDSYIGFWGGVSRSLTSNSSWCDIVYFHIYEKYILVIRDCFQRRCHCQTSLLKMILKSTYKMTWNTSHFEKGVEGLLTVEVLWEELKSWFLSIDLIEKGKSRSRLKEFQDMFSIYIR